MARLFGEGKKYLEEMDEIHFEDKSISFIDLISENTFLLSIFNDDNLRVYQRGSKSKTIKEINQLHTNGA
jgi:hypothetical protein